jgi:hypothetical protein
VVHSVASMSIALRYSGKADKAEDQSQTNHKS